MIKNDPKGSRLTDVLPQAQSETLSTPTGPESTGASKSEGLQDSQVLPRVHRGESSQLPGGSTNRSLLYKPMTAFGDHQKPVMGVVAGAVGAPAAFSGLANAQSTSTTESAAPMGTAAVFTVAEDALTQAALIKTLNEGSAREPFQVLEYARSSSAWEAGLVSTERLQVPGSPDPVTRVYFSIPFGRIDKGELRSLQKFAQVFGAEKKLESKTPGFHTGIESPMDLFTLGIWSVGRGLVRGPNGFADLSVDLLLSSSAVKQLSGSTSEQIADAYRFIAKQQGVSLSNGEVQEAVKALQSSIEAAKSGDVKRLATTMKELSQSAEGAVLAFGALSRLADESVLASISLGGRFIHVNYSHPQITAERARDLPLNDRSPKGY